jgi:hypothetical protein
MFRQGRSRNWPPKRALSCTRNENDDQTLQLGHPDTQLQDLDCLHEPALDDPVASAQSVPEPVLDGQTAIPIADHSPTAKKLDFTDIHDNPPKSSLEETAILAHQSL